MRNLIILGLIFIPLVTVVLTIYFRWFKRRVLTSDERIEIQSRRQELVKLRALFTAKIAELADAKEIKDITAKVSDIDRQLKVIDSGDANPTSSSS